VQERSLLPRSYDLSLWASRAALSNDFRTASARLKEKTREIVRSYDLKSALNNHVFSTLLSGSLTNFTIEVGNAARSYGLGLTQGSCNLIYNFYRDEPCLLFICFLPTLVALEWSSNFFIIVCLLFLLVRIS